MNFVCFFVTSLVVLAPFSTTHAGIEVQLLEFALHGTESSPEAITSALNNGSIAGATRWTTVVKENHFSLGKMSPVRAVKEVDVDGTVTDWSEHEVGTRCAGSVVATDADGFFKITGEYEFRTILGYKLFRIAEGGNSAVAQPMFRTMRKRFDLVMEPGEWYVFTSQPDAGIAPAKGKTTVESVAESASIRVLALRLIER